MVAERGSMRAPKFWTQICLVLSAAWHGWLKDIVIAVGKFTLEVLQEETLKMIKDLVIAYKDTDLSGEQKRTIVFEAAKEKLEDMGREVPGSIINFAIELFVAELKKDKNDPA